MSKACLRQGPGTKPRYLRSRAMGNDQREAAKRAIAHYRRLREWITDLPARKALRELIRSAEAKLTDEDEKGPRDGD